MLSSYFTRDWASENDSIQDERIPIELSHLPWDSHGDIDMTMEEARWRELPILAVFTNWSKPEAWRKNFRDSDVLAVVENCFVLALFNTSDHNDPTRNEAMRLWGEDLHDSCESGYIRIVSSKGKVVARTEALSDDIGHSLKEMERIFMEAWYQLENMRSAWELGGELGLLCATE